MSFKVMDMRRAYKCGKCGREYTEGEYETLRTIPVNPENVYKYGIAHVCECGYRFYLDRWSKRTEVQLKEDTVTVSTIFLEMNHGSDEKPLWYETMIFPDKANIHCLDLWRYETREEAEKHHDEIVRLLRAGKYRIYPSEYTLEVIE
jgi:hypothetical protein